MRTPQLYDDPISNITFVLYVETIIQFFNELFHHVLFPIWQNFHVYVMLIFYVYDISVHFISALVKYCQSIK